MALSITHSYVSAVPDAGDASLVQPSDWNDVHDISGLAAGIEDFLATPSSANLKTAVTDETGSGALVFANTPTLVTPVLGVASATSINKVAITAPATSATLTIADGKTLTASNTLTFTGTDASSVAFGAGGTVLYSGGALTATAVTVADEASDTTCFPLFATAATGDLGPKSNAGLTFNSSTGELGAKTLLLAQGTITDVALNLSGTVTWNDGADTFTAWKLDVTNTASNGASKLIDLQVGTVSQFSVTRTGVVAAASNINSSGEIRAANGNVLGWASQGGFYTEANGAITATNNAVNGFTRLKFGPSGPGIYIGSGSPESAITAEPGSIYLNTAGGTDTSLYTKGSGSSNTGWIAVDNV
jgi:hypothetical protein